MSRRAGYWEVTVKCPFYRRTEKNKHRIICDGITDETRLTLVFLGPDATRVKHLKEFCCENYEKCPLYHAAGDRFEK